MKQLYIECLDILSPGLVGWDEAASVLRGDVPFLPGELPPFPAGLMNSNEKRRTTPMVRLTLQVMNMLSKKTKYDIKQTLTVFSSSEGDLNITDAVCEALASPGIPVSPVQFSSVVHNAAAGYWSITSGQTAPSVSISGSTGSYAAGLIEAYANILNGLSPIAFLCYDYPGPERLKTYRPVSAPFASAMLLTPEKTETTGFALSLEIIQKHEADKLEDPDLEALRLGNPAARGLPLLKQIASGQVGSVTLGYHDDLSLVVHVQPVV